MFNLIQVRYRVAAIGRKVKGASPRDDNYADKNQ